jgi:hypothetical protein
MVGLKHQGCDVKMKDKDEPPISAGSATISGIVYAVIFVNPPVDG